MPIRTSGLVCRSYWPKTGTLNPPYIADLYEHVSLPGDVNRQIAHLPDGTTVRLPVKRVPPP